MSIKFLENLCLSKTYFENSSQEYNGEFNEDYIEAEDCEYLSNDYLDIISSNYQVPVINKNKLHILNYINGLGLILTKEGLYKKENYNSKYNLVDFFNSKGVEKETDTEKDTDTEIDIDKNNIEKIKNFFRQKKTNINVINTKIKKEDEKEIDKDIIKENKNVWFKEAIDSKLIKINNKIKNFDKEFPSLIKDEINIDKIVTLPDNIDNNDDDDDDDEYDLKHLIQKTNYREKPIEIQLKKVEKPIEIQGKNRVEKPIDYSNNFKTNKNDKDNGWIKVETNKEIKNIRDRNNAYDILSDKDKLKTKLKRTKLCLSIINKTICPHKENCRYAHKFEDLEQCLFSDNCRFIKKDKGTYTNISKTKICEYKHKNETASTYFNRISVNNHNISSPDKNLNIKKL